MPRWSLLDRSPQSRAAAHLLQGLRPLRAARRLRAVRLGGAAPRGRPGPPAVLLQRPRPGRRGRGARPPGCRHRARDTHDRRAHLGRRAAARARPRPGPLADQLLLVLARRRPRRGRGDATACASAACSCAAAAPSAARGRCASPTGHPRKTSASCRHSPRCSRAARVGVGRKHALRPATLTVLRIAKRHGLPQKRHAYLLQLSEMTMPASVPASLHTLARATWSSSCTWRFS